MANFSIPGAATRATATSRPSRVPSHYLGSASRTPSHRHAGVSGSLPRVPSVTTTTDEASRAAEAVMLAHRATQRRRRLLAIFGRMMARFHDRHERHWSMGRWECSLCHCRIVAWAWLPVALPEAAIALHEECVSRSMWDVVLYHERLIQRPDASSVMMGMLI